MNKSSKWITFLILVVGLVFASVLIRWVPGQLDLTANKIYTLSPGSKSLVKKIEAPVTLQFYFSSSVEQIMDEATTMYFKNFASRIQGLLEQFESASNGMIVVEVIDPKPDTKEEEGAIRAGLQSQQLPTGENLFMGMLAIQADQEEVISVFNPQREAFLEYDIAQTIYKVQQLTKPKLGLLSSLPVMGTQPPMMGMMNPNQPRPEPKWFFVEELEANYDVQEIRPSDQGLPVDLDVLVVVHPKNLSNDLLYDLDQYILSGKPLFLALDSSSYIERTQQQARGGMFMGPMGAASELSTLLDAYGIDFNNEKFVADRKQATLVGGRGGMPVRHPAWITINGLDANSPVTANLDTLVFAESGSFSLNHSVVNRLKIEALASSSEQSSSLDTTMLPYGTPESLIQSVSIGDPQVLAGYVTGKFKTAFPEGKPVTVRVDSEEAEGEKKDEKKFEKDPKQIEESAEEVRLFLLADTDFLADHFTVERVNFLGMNTVQPINSNVAFFRNVVDSLAGSDDLITIRGKGTVTRPFIVVREMEMVAEKNFQVELEQVNSELSQIRDSISQLQSSNKDSNSIVLTPEVREKLKKFKEQEAEFLSRRREIRKELREDIETLDSTLAGLNLIAVPAVISLFGIGFFRSRYSFR